MSLYGRNQKRYASSRISKRDIRSTNMNMNETQIILNGLGLFLFKKIKTHSIIVEEVKKFCTVENYQIFF